MDFGVIKTKSKEDFAQRLIQIQEDINEIIPTLQEEAIEEVIEVEEAPEITEPVSFYLLEDQTNQ